VLSRTATYRRIFQTRSTRFYLSSPPPQKYFPSRFAKITSITRASRPTRGAFRDRHGRWVRDAVDAACADDERAWRGRRSRVVLTPRRWRQVGRDASRILASDGGNKARLTRKSTKETVKTNRVRECRVKRRNRGDLSSCGFIFSTRGCGCGWSTRHSPRPQGRRMNHDLGARALRESLACPVFPPDRLRERGYSEAQGASYCAKPSISMLKRGDAAYGSRLALAPLAWPGRRLDGLARDKPGHDERMERNRTTPLLQSSRRCR
jgi:hypothetical protein